MHISDSPVITRLRLNCAIAALTCAPPELSERLPMEYRPLRTGKDH